MSNLDLVKRIREIRKITPKQVEKWKKDFLKTYGGDKRLMDLIERKDMNFEFLLEKEKTLNFWQGLKKEGDAWTGDTELFRLGKLGSGTKRKKVDVSLAIPVMGILWYLACKYNRLMTLWDVVCLVRAFCQGEAQDRHFEEFEKEVRKIPPGEYKLYMPGKWSRNWVFEDSGYSKALYLTARANNFFLGFYREWNLAVLGFKFDHTGLLKILKSVYDDQCRNTDLWFIMNESKRSIAVSTTEDTYSWRKDWKGYDITKKVKMYAADKRKEIYLVLEQDVRDLVKLLAGESLED